MVPVTPDPIAWDVAEKVAVRVAALDPFSVSYHAHSLVDDFTELTAEAESLVSAATGLVSDSGPARVRVVDREGWIRANVASFRRLLSPISGRMADKMSKGLFAGRVTRVVAGAELGALLGWMSGKVLGQYDLLVVDDDTAVDQDIVYYVGPNVLALEKRFAFPPREFRLWLALHEVTHRAQFTGVPWLRPHFLSLVEAGLGPMNADPAQLTAALQHVGRSLRRGTNPLQDGGLAVLLATPEQRAVIEEIGGMMSLLEGHGDVTMDRAGADRIPSADRFSRVLRQRRASVSGIARFGRQIIGLEAKMAQYALGERFVLAVEKAGGTDLLDRVWLGPQYLPSMNEIREPATWIARIQSAQAV